MSARLAELHRSADRDQIQAWVREIELVSDAIQELGHLTKDWSLLFETPLLRLGRRIDVVVIAPGVIMVQERVICFVTGTPGAGKTLLGLNLALKSRVAGGKLPLASLLSGNPPLVHVLIEALAHDAYENRGLKKPDARREAGSAVQGLLGFLREHGDGAPPPEHVLVFDEAQRAWDAEVGQKLLGRPRSEPALFLDIMARADWACLICLVGPGQEINRGEGGLPLWGEALIEAAEANNEWLVFAAPQAIRGHSGDGLVGLFDSASRFNSSASGAAPPPCQLYEVLP